MLGLDIHAVHGVPPLPDISPITKSGFIIILHALEMFI